MIIIDHFVITHWAGIYSGSSNYPEVLFRNPLCLDCEGLFKSAIFVNLWTQRKKDLPFSYIPITHPEIHVTLRLTKQGI